MMVISSHTWPHAFGITWRPLGISWGVLAPLLLLFILAGYAQTLSLFLWDLRFLTPIRAYSKSGYLAVHFGSAPDTPWSLSRASMGPILNMVHRTPLVSK